MGASSFAPQQGTSEATVDAPREPAFAPWLFLGLGALGALVGTFLPLAAYMGHFVGALTHEMGHCAVGFLFGFPSIPAISLEGEAVSVHEGRSLFVLAVMWGVLACGATRVRAGARRVAALVAVVALYPALAFTPARELLVLLAGHAGELAFATLALWRALTGGFTSSSGERALYGVLGWALLARNVRLAFGIATSAAARAEYRANVSFGVPNDYVRVAEDLLECSLASVGVGMTLLGVAALPLVFWLARGRR